MLLSYTIRHRKTGIVNTNYDTICVTHNTFLNQSYYILEHMNNGNYSIEIAAVSMAGPGNFTPVQYVVIKENAGVNIWTVVLILLGVFLALLAALCYGFKRYYITSISSMKLIANVNPDYAGVHYKQVNAKFKCQKSIEILQKNQRNNEIVLLS